MAKKKTAPGIIREINIASKRFKKGYMAEVLGVDYATFWRKYKAGRFTEAEIAKLRTIWAVPA